MSEITVSFEFEIGELVFFRDAAHCHGIRPKRFIIEERFAQQCHGGIQRLYRLHGYPRDSGYLGVPEIVLSREEPAFIPVSQAELDDRNRRADEEHKGFNLRHGSAR
jgi:hypothetical protein